MTSSHVLCGHDYRQTDIHTQHIKNKFYLPFRNFIMEVYKLSFCVKPDFDLL